VEQNNEKQKGQGGREKGERGGKTGFWEDFDHFWGFEGDLADSVTLKAGPGGLLNGIVPRETGGFSKGFAHLKAIFGVI
jgi:hypothetical protein